MKNKHLQLLSICWIMGIVSAGYIYNEYSGNHEKIETPKNEVSSHPETRTLLSTSLQVHRIR